MAYELYSICIKEMGVEDAISEPVIISVGDTYPEEGGDDDNATFYHFYPDEWSELCKALEEGYAYEVEGDFTVENHGETPIEELGGDGEEETQTE
jgi:hypothetical protein